MDDVCSCSFFFALGYEGLTLEYGGYEHGCYFMALLDDISGCSSAVKSSNVPQR